MRDGQYSFSAKRKDKHLIELGEEYKLLAIKSGVNFSKLVFNAMEYYKKQGQLEKIQGLSHG